MARTSKQAIILWLATSLSIVSFVAGFTVDADPFGYFGMNRLGYYFSSERQFKYNLVKNADYNAIILGDSRIAFTDPSFVKIRGLHFVNGGMGGATFKEQAELLRASRVDRLKFAVMGLILADLTRGNCHDDARDADMNSGFWQPARFAVTWNQFRDAMKVIWSRAQGRFPLYHADGTRSAGLKYFEDAALSQKTERYWNKLKDSSKEDQRAGAEIDPTCRELLIAMQHLADREGFTLIVMLMPRNRDLDLVNANAGQRVVKEGQLLARLLKDVVPNIVDETNGPFSAAENFWLFDPKHFRPEVGGGLVRDVIERSGGLQASK